MPFLCPTPNDDGAAALLLCHEDLPDLDERNYLPLEGANEKHATGGRERRRDTPPPPPPPPTTLARAPARERPPTTANHVAVSRHIQAAAALCGLSAEAADGLDLKTPPRSPRAEEPGGPSSAVASLLGAAEVLARQEHLVDGGSPLGIAVAVGFPPTPKPRASAGPVPADDAGPASPSAGGASLLLCDESLDPDDDCGGGGADNDDGHAPPGRAGGDAPAPRGRETEAAAAAAAAAPAPSSRAGKAKKRKSRDGGAEGGASTTTATGGGRRPGTDAGGGSGRDGSGDGGDGDEDDGGEGSPTACVERILKDKALYKSLLLKMALAREKPKKSRSSPASARPTPVEVPVEDRGGMAEGGRAGDEDGDGDGRGQKKTSQIILINEGFFWKDFPALEHILRSHMGEYYDLSTFRRQSKAQQTFNNRLVGLVREKAARSGWAFDPAVFDDKRLRDRVRCFFKTLIQNAKKRLHTMLRNPHKRRNREALRGLLRQHVEDARREGGGKKVRRSTSASAARPTSGDGKAAPAPPGSGIGKGVVPPATVTSSDDSDGDVSSDELTSSEELISSEVLPDGDDMEEDTEAPDCFPPSKPGTRSRKTCPQRDTKYVYDHRQTMVQNKRHRLS